MRSTGNKKELKRGRSNDRLKPEPSLTFTTVAQDIVREILDQEFAGKGEVDSDSSPKREQFGKHLKMITAHLKNTFGDVTFPERVLDPKERILVMDVANHAMKLSDMSGDDSVFIQYSRSKNPFLEFVCKAAMGKDEFIDNFISKNNIHFSGEAEREYYKEFFKRSSKELITELTKNYIVDNKDFHTSLVVYDSEAKQIEPGLDGDNFIKLHSTICGLYRNSFESQFSAKATVDDNRDVTTIRGASKGGTSSTENTPDRKSVKREEDDKEIGAKKVAFSSDAVSVMEQSLKPVKDITPPSIFMFPDGSSVMGSQEHGGLGG
ncbi:MAG: hypothetical protein KGQ36_00300 [Rickettsiales bacterium]|nr:hypothetical protein [Rickettsiales bacterium]